MTERIVRKLRQNEGIRKGHESKNFKLFEGLLWKNVLKADGEDDARFVFEMCRKNLNIHSSQQNNLTMNFNFPDIDFQ